MNDGVLCHDPKKRWELMGEMPPRMEEFCAGGVRDRADTKNKRVQPQRMNRDLQTTHQCTHTVRHAKRHQRERGRDEEKTVRGRERKACVGSGGFRCDKASMVTECLSWFM